MPNITLLKNAFANVCRNSTGALVILLLPPFLTKILSKDAYGTWLLILQLSTYVSFLDFGIQTAVGRYVAYYNELGEFKKRDSIVSTALAILAGSAVLAILGISIIAWQLPNLFKDMPTSLHQEAQLALLYVGISLAITLPFSVFSGIFIGLQRYDIPAWIFSISKFSGGLFVVLIAHSSQSIGMMGFIMGIVNIGAAIWQFLSYRKLSCDIHISRKLLLKSAGIEIGKYCFGLWIWSVGLLLVSGLDAIIIGRIDYKSIQYYVVASTLVAFITTLQNSVFGALLPFAARLSANNDSKSLGELLIFSTKICALMIMVFGSGLFIYSYDILNLWIGIDHAKNGTVILQLLLIANMGRSALIPYSVLIMATGEQKLVMESPLIEGVVNVLISIIAGSIFGVNGVAFGTIVGVIVLWSLCLLRNMPRTKKIFFNRKRYMRESLLFPFLTVSIPVTANYILLNMFAKYIPIILMPLWITTFLIALTFSVLLCFSYTEKQKLLVLIRSQIKK
jgi:O-antigen/teichoic acid export membrane protein